MLHPLLFLYFVPIRELHAHEPVSEVGQVLDVEVKLILVDPFEVMRIGHFEKRTVLTQSPDLHQVGQVLFSVIV